MVLMRTDPFRELDRLAQNLLGTPTSPAMMPMDAWRDGEDFRAEFDLPGVDPATIDLHVERNVLTVRAERPKVEATDEQVASERPRGTFSRQLILGDNLDVDRIEARYVNGVLQVRIPIAEDAKPRRIEIGTGDRPLEVAA